jgi:hypothetical protein
MAIEDLENETGAEEDFGSEEEVEEKQEEDKYMERKTHDKAVEDFEKLKKTSIDITNYQKTFQENMQTLNALRLLVGVEDSRLRKLEEDLSVKWQSIQKLNIRKGSGGVYEEPALMLERAVSFFEDRKDLTELERAYLRVLSQKFFEAISLLDGMSITNKAIQVSKEMMTERMAQNEQNLKEWVNNKIEVFMTKIKTYEELDILKTQLSDKELKIVDLENKLKMSQKTIDTLSAVVEEAGKSHVQPYQQPYQPPQSYQPQPAPQFQPGPQAQPVRQAIRLDDSPASGGSGKSAYDNVIPYTDDEVKKLAGEKLLNDANEYFRKMAAEGKNPLMGLQILRRQLNKTMSDDDSMKVVANFRNKLKKAKGADVNGLHIPVAQGVGDWEEEI